MTITVQLAEENFDIVLNATKDSGLNLLDAANKEKIVTIIKENDPTLSEDDVEEIYATIIHFITPVE